MRAQGKQCKSAFNQSVNTQNLGTLFSSSPELLSIEIASHVCKMPRRITSRWRGKLLHMDAVLTMIRVQTPRWHAALRRCDFIGLDQSRGLRRLQNGDGVRSWSKMSLSPPKNWIQEESMASYPNPRAVPGADHNFNLKGNNVITAQVAKAGKQW